jgi:hypothetical protein
MANRIVPVPYFPVPPKEYDQKYFNEVIRAFSVYLEQARNPGVGRNTSAVYTNLQDDDFELEVGAIFKHGDYVKIVTENTANVRGSAGTGAVGSVTVTIA